MDIYYLGIYIVNILIFYFKHVFYMFCSWLLHYECSHIWAYPLYEKKINHLGMKSQRRHM